MPEYYFSARDHEGKSVSGQRNARDPDDLANQLIQEGYVPLEISKAQAKGVVSKKKDKRDFFAPRVTNDDLHIFSRQMYSLIHAGIPLATAITRLAETSRNKTMADALSSIVVNINKGMALHTAMAQYPNIFSNFIISLITVGENTGNLDNIFLHIADYLELEVDITKKVKAALRYPTLVIIAIVIALIVINIFVIPAFSKLYSSMHGVLPLPTRILLAVSDFMLSYWYVILGAILIIAFFIRYYIRTVEGAIQWGRWQLKIPVIGWLIHRILLARFARLLALVLKAGVTAVDGIHMVGVTTNNAYITQQIAGVSELIERGNTISSAIEKTHLFPPLIIQMIMLGEESGTMERLLDEVADYYQREIDYDIVRLSDAIEPILLVVIGAMVLILALGVFLPMWNLASLVK